MGNNIILCKAKLNRAKVTQASESYHGSLTIDKEIMDLLKVYPYEKVLVVNIDNGNRFETYLIPGEYGKREIGLNGGAAKLGKVGDTIGFVVFGIYPEEIAIGFKPIVYTLEENGDLVEIKQKEY
ncbi:MAG TPA: aspartate 1-decarboxylase [Bacteroidales bacterium]|nr:aspartate 1-decarboxylase [Bacteroidales bacterium]